MNNIKNKLISKQIVEDLVNKYINICDQETLKTDLFIDPFKEISKTQYKVKNINLIQRAFFHSSFDQIDYNQDPEDSYNCMYIPKYLLGNYETIEFSGDRVIELAITNYIVRKHDTLDQGEYTKLKSRMVSKKALSELADKIGFKEFTMIGNHLERNNGRNNPRFLEDIFESFMECLYVDLNEDHDLCKKFIKGLQISFVDTDYLIANNTDYKTQLIMYYHKNTYGNPEYQLMYTICRENNTFNREFTCVTLIDKTKYIFNPSINFIPAQKKILDTYRRDLEEIKLTYLNSELPQQNSINLETLMRTGILVGMGKGSTKKEAEQKCAHECLLNLKVL